MPKKKKKKNPRLLEASLVPFLLPHGSLSFHLDPLNLVPFFLASMRPQDCHTPNPFQNILSELSSEPLHCKSHWNPTAAPKAAYSQQFTQPFGVQSTSTSPVPVAIENRSPKDTLEPPSQSLNPGEVSIAPHHHHQCLRTLQYTDFGFPLLI